MPDLRITLVFLRTGGGVLSLPVMSLKMKKNNWGWPKTDNEGPHHCRFVAYTDSELVATYRCRFKPRADSDWALSLSVLAKNRW